MKTEMLEFKPGDNFPLPKSVSYKKVDGRHLFIATEVPSWIVVNDAEAEVIQRMQGGATISDCVLVFRSHGHSASSAEAGMKKLLQLLIGFFFFRAAEPRTSAGNFRRLQIHLTNACNLRCSHCYVSSGLPFSDEMKLDDWKATIDYMRSRYEHVHVSISGGEPLMVRWLPDLLAYAKQVRGCDTAVITNGMLWTKQKARSLAPLLDRVALSLDGATAAIHDHVRGPGSFDKALSGLRLIADAGIKVGLNITLMRRNKDDLLTNLHPLIKQLGFKVDLDIANFVAEGRGAADSGQALGQAEFRDTLSELTGPFLEETWKPMAMGRRGNCGYGKTLAVYANGDVTPCLSPRFIRGNIRRDGVEALFDGVKEEERSASVDELPLCRSCDVRYICGGKCHLNHFPQTKIMRQNDCTNGYRQTFYKNLADRFESIKKSYPFAQSEDMEVNQEQTKRFIPISAT